jgi:hypothetical protein
MPNLSKLDETIDQFEKQTEMLKQNNKVLAKVSELATAIQKGVTELDLGNKTIDETKKDIQNTLKSLNALIDNLERQNDKHIESIITSNKKYIRELEDTVSSKLERFSSDIQVSNRQEKIQLQEALQNNISNQFNNLESKQKDLFAVQSRQISLLKFLLIVVIGLCIGFGIKLFI